MAESVKHLRGLASFLVFTLGLFILGCAPPPVMIDRAIVLNATAKQITEVEVFHETTQKSGEVNMILPRAIFDIGFSGKPLLAG